MATKGGKQPYAIAMNDRSPLGIAGIWGNWKGPACEWVCAFAVLITKANDWWSASMTACRRPARVAGGVSGRAHDHVADLDAGETRRRMRTKLCLKK